MKPFMFSAYGRLNGQLIEVVKHARPDNLKTDIRQFFQNLKNMRTGFNKKKHQQLTIVAHNGAKFDWVLVLPILIEVFVDLNIAGSSSDLKRIGIPECGIVLQDFCLLVQGRLGDIAKLFGTADKKS